jgi:hypothetical protein
VSFRVARTEGLIATVGTSARIAEAETVGPRSLLLLLNLGGPWQTMLEKTPNGEDTCEPRTIDIPDSSGARGLNSDLHD